MDSMVVMSVACMGLEMINEVRKVGVIYIGGGISRVSLVV
jgi:hypothetical protein